MPVSVRIHRVLMTSPPSRSERENRFAAHVDVVIAGLGIEPFKTTLPVSFDNKEELPAAVLGKLKTFAQELNETADRPEPWMG